MIAAHLLLLQAHVQHRHSSAPKSEVASVKRFTQNFYDWYIRMGNERDQAWFHGDHAAFRKKFPYPDEPWDYVAIKLRPQLFSPEIRRGLEKDRAEQDKHPGELWGLDFDPIVSGQDPADHYWVSKIERKGKSWRVSMMSRYGQRAHQADVIAVVEKTNTKEGWRFTDFIYDKDFDLFKALQAPN